MAAKRSEARGVRTSGEGAWAVVARASLGAAAAATAAGWAVRLLGPLVRAVADLVRLPTTESVRLLTSLLAGG